MKPISVDDKNDTLLGEIPFCRVKNIKIDMRESEDDYNLTGMEYTRNTEEYGRDRILVCITHRYGDTYIYFPKNTSNCKTHPSAHSVPIMAFFGKKLIGQLFVQNIF